MTSNTQNIVLPRSLLAVFALPGILQGFMLTPGNFLVQGIYAKESGLELVAMGTAIIVVRIFDCFSDLLIGYFSDRGAQRGRSRKAWIAIGTLVSVVAMWFLFRPPSPVSLAYYAIWFLVANIGWSLIEIPYRSWNISLTSDYVQRTRAVTWVAVATVLGALLFYAVAPVTKALGINAGGVDFQLLGLVAVICAVLLPPLNLLTLLKVPDGQAVATPEQQVAAPKESLSLIWKSVIGNRPLIKLLVCFGLLNLLSGLAQGVSLLYFTNYLGLSTEVMGVFALAIPLGLIGIPFWGWLSARYPRNKVWAVSMGFAGVAYFAMGFLPPNPGVAPVLVSNSILLFCIMCTLVAAPAIMGDIVDYGKKHYGVDRAGLYMAFMAQLLKGVAALSAGAGLILLGWMGFDATKSGADLTPQAVFALKLVAAWLPAVGFILTAPLIWTLEIGGDPAPARTSMPMAKPEYP